MSRKQNASSCSQTLIMVGVAVVALGLLIAEVIGVDLPPWLDDLLSQDPVVVTQPDVSLPPESQPAPGSSDNGQSPPAPIPGTVPDGAVPATLIRVVDGDTAEMLVNGQPVTVRYVGIDTPERDEPGYKAAQQANRRLLGDGDLFLVKDRTDTDRYGRLLRFIYTADGVFVNQEMIVQGYAQPIEYKPDVTLADEFRRVGSEAAKARRGFWSGQGEPDGAMAYALTTEETALREGPGSRTTNQDTIPVNTPMTVYGRDSGGRWLQVRLPDRQGGWVQANKVYLNVPVATLAITGEGSGEALPVPTATPVMSSEDIDGIVLRVVENTGSNEIIALRNLGRTAVRVGGWQLSGSRGDQVCIVPDGITVPAGERYLVVSGRSEVSGLGFKCSGSFLWSNEGETIYLRALDGRQIQVNSAQTGE